MNWTRDHGFDTLRLPSTRFFFVSIKMLLRVFTFLATSVSVFAIRSNTTSCRVLPGDADWPGTDEWAKLNTTVNGRLIATIPDGYVCHEPTYDADACATLAQTWNLPQSQYARIRGIEDDWVC